MSDIPGSSASASENPQLSPILEESEDKIYDPHDPNQSFPSNDSPLEVAEAGEGYFSFYKLIQENPNLSWAATIEDKIYDPHVPDQSIPTLPSHLSPTVEVAEVGEEYFSFDKLIQENPNLSWAATVEDERDELHPLHDIDQSLQLLQPPHDSPTVEVPEEEYFIFDKFIEENPNLSWAAVYDEGEGGRQEEPVAATLSASTLPARHSAQTAVTPASDRSSSSDSLMRALLQPPPPMRRLEPPQEASPSSMSPSHLSTKDRSTSSDSLMRALLQPPPPMRVMEPPQKASPSSMSPSHASPKGEGGRQEEPVAATLSPSTLPARHSAQTAVTPASERSSSSDSLMRTLLQPPPPMRRLEPPQEASPSSMSPSHLSTKGRSSSSDSLMRALLQPPPPMRVMEPPQKASPSSMSLSHASPKGEGAGEERVAATLSPSTLPVRHSAQTAVTPASDRSSSSDSLIRALLQPPPMRVMEPSQKKATPSSMSPSHVSSKGDGGRQEEPVAATMTPSTLPARRSAQTAVTPASDRSTSSDSLMRALLQPPPPMRGLEPPRKASPSSMAPSHASSKEEASSFQQQELMETAFLGGSSRSAEETSSPQSRSKRRRSELGSSSQSSSTSENIPTPPWHIDTGLADLDAKSALFLARHLSPPIMEKPHAQQQFSTAIDPYAVGLATMHDVLRDGAYLTKELRTDARAMGRRRPSEPCVCGVTRHPSWWPADRVQDVHNYSFLLDCQDLVLSRDTILAVNHKETITVYDVPMERNNPVKIKAEQVLRFVDVEVGYGDQTCDNLFHYYQPANRKVLIVVSNNRVVGIVVAEKIQFAHRILRETASYMDLEEHPVSVRVGINRLWVHISLRRRHLASMLCKLIGNCFFENETLLSEDYAFNNISDAMVMFAKVFLKTLRPPLYTRLR